VGAISSIPGFPGDQNSKDALKTAQVYLEMPLHDKSADIEKVLNEEHDNIMTGNKSIDDAIRSMNERVADVLKS
jgi:multiple sugar transport system substrate-binding protein